MRTILLVLIMAGLSGCGRTDTFSATRCISCEGKLMCFDTPNVPDPFTCHYIEGQGYSNVRVK